MKTRLTIIKIFFFILATLAITKLYFIQVRDGKIYRLKAENQINFLNQILLLRGGIYLENSTPLSISKFFPTLYIVPREIKQPKLVEKKILSILPNVDKDILEKKIYKKNDPYEPIKSHLNKEQEKAVKSWHLKGVHLQKKVERYFPFKEMASHVLGFVSLDDRGRLVGRYGIEKTFENYLKQGDNVILSLDKNIQSESEEILEDLVKKWKAKGGQVIVLESQTGRILAMASWPNFDPNSYWKYPIKNFLNPNIESVWEPGSVFKVITMASGLDSKAIVPETKYFDKGFVKMDDRTIYNWDKRGHGWQNMTDILAKSLNTGAVFIEKRIGHKKFLDYIKKFGIGEKTNIELPDEVVGSLKNLEKKDSKEINFATASFGQGVSVTPIEMIMAINTIATNGLLLKPIIVDKVINSDGKIEKEFKTTIVRRVVSRRTAEEVKEMMVKAVEHGRIGHIKGYNMAAKTGTAQVPYKGGYLNKYVHTYIGFGPAGDPRFTVLLKLDQPEGNILSGATVVPAFKKLAEFLLNYFKIPSLSNYEIKN